MTLKVFGIILTSLGIIGMIYAAATYFGVTGFARYDAWVPFVIAIIFFVAGISMLKSSPSEEEKRT